MSEDGGAQIETDNTSTPYHCVCVSLPVCACVQVTLAFT